MNFRLDRIVDELLHRNFRPSLQLERGLISFDFDERKRVAIAIDERNAFMYSVASYEWIDDPDLELEATVDVRGANERLYVLIKNGHSAAFQKAYCTTVDAFLRKLPRMIDNLCEIQYFLAAQKR